jgi:aryl-alcohol dehydrogenase-like predicted oxidoreductase
VIATKFGWGQGPGDGAAHGFPDAIRSSLDASLRRLRTDRVDIYYYHRPDGITPIEETLGALGDLVREGLVRLAACSNVGVPDLVEADAATTRGGSRPSRTPSTS